MGGGARDIDGGGHEGPRLSLRDPASGRAGLPDDPAGRWTPGDGTGPRGLGEALGRGRGRLVLITGERGSGRSRCASTILDHVRAVSDVAAVAFDVPAIAVPAIAVDRAGERAVDRAGERWGSGGREEGPRAARRGVPAGLVAAVARVRPEGPAARLVAELVDEPAAVDAEPGPDGWPDPQGLLEEQALVLVSEAARRPLTLLLEDVHLADEDTYALVEHLFCVIDTVPLLMVITATGGWDAHGPHARRWCGWIGRHGVEHLPVGPLPRRELASAVAQVWPGAIPAEDLDGILTSARGNPRLAQELALWTCQGASGEQVPRAGLVHRLVTAHEEDRILGALAVAQMPLGVRALGAVTSTSTAQVRAVLERAQAAGLVEPASVTGPADAYVMAHPMFAAAARGLLPPDGLRGVHLAVASALIAAYDGEDTAPDIARHLVASGHPRADTGLWCLRAATSCEGSGRLSEAVGFAQAGLDADPDPQTRMELLDGLARCQVRSGDSRAAAATLRAALRTLSGEPAIAVPVLVELLELAASAGDGPEEALLARAGDACPADRPDLQARLRALEALGRFRSDPDAGRRVAERAVLEADATGNGTAQAQALVVAARTLMDPACLGDLERVSGRLMRHPTPDGFASAVAAALARADRPGLDVIVREYAWRESRHPHQRLRDELTLVRGVIAALEGKTAAFAQALGQLSAATSPHVRVHAALLPEIWCFNTGRFAQGEAPEIAGLPGSELMAELLWLSRILGRPVDPHPCELDLVRQRLGDGEDLLRARDDGTGTVRLASAARLAAFAQDRDLASLVVHALEPFADQFAVVWPFVPVGPVGWYLAPLLRLLGAPDRAEAALSAARGACEGLGAGGWALRVAGEQARSRTDAGAPGLDDLVRETIGPVAARRFAGVVAEVRCGLAWQQSGPLSSTACGGTTSLPGVPTTIPAPDGTSTTPTGMPVLTGRAAVSPATAPPAVSPDRQQMAALGLTAREVDIMALAAIGCTNQEIANRLFLSIATVERHCTNLYRRLGVRNRAQALGIIGSLGLTEATR